MAFSKASKQKAQEREDDAADDRAASRAEDRAEVKRLEAPAPIVPPAPKRVLSQDYPRWVKLGDLAVVVENAAQEKAVASKAAKVEVVKSAQGDSVRIV